MSLRVIIPPGAEPVSSTELATHSRIDSTDGLEGVRVAAARERIESLIWRTLVLTTYEERFDCFPDVIRLQRGPVREIVSITYVDTAGVTQTLSASLYQADLTSEPCRIVPAYAQTWPTTRSELAAVRVQYRAGYAVPFTVVTATDLLTALDHWFADGDALTAWNTGGALPAGLTNRARYFARDVSGDDLKLAATSGGSAVDITADTGGGTHFLGGIPEDIRSAVLLIAAELNEQREQSVSGTIVSKAVLAAENLALPYRLPM